MTSARGASDSVRGRGTETDRDRCRAMREKEEGETGVKAQPCQVRWRDAITNKESREEGFVFKSLTE